MQKSMSYLGSNPYITILLQLSLNLQMKALYLSIISFDLPLDYTVYSHLNNECYLGSVYDSSNFP